MKFCYDHDLHIHSTLSVCGNDPKQTPERILAYAKETEREVFFAISVMISLS